MVWRIGGFMWKRQNIQLKFVIVSVVDRGLVNSIQKSDGGNAP
jgi:hypothetical protein